MGEDGHFFETYGPFTLEKIDGKIARPSSKWWDDTYGTAAAIGCYMFTMGDVNIKPWYIGKTINKRGFREEAFTDHKLNHYNSVIDKYRGPPGIYFFPLLTRPFNELGVYARGGSHGPAIEWLEKMLIGMAYAQNQKLLNIRDATFLKTVHVRGVLGRKVLGAPHGEIAKARQALLGDRPPRHDR